MNNLPAAYAPGFTLSPAIAGSHSTAFRSWGSRPRLRGLSLNCIPILGLAPQALCFRPLGGLGFTIVKRTVRVLSRKFFGEDPYQCQNPSYRYSCLASLWASCPPKFPQRLVADDYNSIFKTVKWRSIGPFRGGRSVAGTGVVGDPKTYYMGTTGGGLWKTDDMGITWRNISDGYFKTGSVGAIAVAESDPNVVYVGMGEHAVRGVMTHHGDGVYKSTDAGKTWKRDWTGI